MWRLMIDGLFWEHGVIYRVTGMQRDPTLAAPWFRIAWNDLITPPARGLSTGEFLVNDTIERLSLLVDAGVEPRAVAFNPANGNECARIRGSETARKTCEQAGLTTWGPQGCLILAVTAEIRPNAGAFVTTHLSAFCEAQLERAFPELVREARARFTREDLTQILRCLSDEGIAVRDLRAILEALLSIIGVTTVDVGRDIVFTGRTGLIYPVPEGQSRADLRPADYADAVRMALKRYISHKYSRGSGTLVVYLLDPAWEAKLSGKEPLAPAERQELLEAMAAEFGALARRAPAAVILTTHYARRRLHGIMQYDFPGVAVLSYQELAPDINIQPIARISPPATPAVRQAKKG
jgi:type III secretion protein V